MSRVVRVVGMADEPERAVQDRLVDLPPALTGSTVATRAGVLVTLSAGYSWRPGHRRRAIRALQAELAKIVGP